MPAEIEQMKTRFAMKSLVPYTLCLTLAWCAPMSLSVAADAKPTEKKTEAKPAVDPKANSAPKAEAAAKAPPKPDVKPVAKPA